MEYSIRHPSELQIEPLPFPTTRANVANEDNYNFQTNTQIDPIILLRRLSNIVSFKLQEASIPLNLSRFSRSINEDLEIHIKKFVEIFITNLVINYRNCLIWFLIILRNILDIDSI